MSRRSIVTAVDVRAYETIAPWMLCYKRPGTGIEPGHAERVIGMRARRNLPKDSVLQWDDLVAPVQPDAAFEPVEKEPDQAPRPKPASKANA